MGRHGGTYTRGVGDTLHLRLGCRLREIDDDEDDYDDYDDYDNDDDVNDEDESAGTIKTDAPNGKSNADGLKRFLTFQ